MDKDNSKNQEKDSGDKEFMFQYDDQSPKQSPRDPLNASSNSQASESPSNSPRPKKTYSGPSNFLTQSSPPKFVSFDEIMKAANGVTNMTLAHEIAVDNDFRFQKNQPPKNSLENQVREIMHKAFWDVLQEKLREDPPDYSQAMALLQELKESVLELMLPHHHRIKAQIEEVLDLELIEQKADHGAFDLQYYADFVINIMSQLCAPVRDEEIANLRENKELVPLFKTIFAMLDVLKLDMANFTIQQVRPYIQSQSVEYERKKFQQLLDQQKENNLDGLQFTKSWLQRASDKVHQQVAAQLDSGGASSQVAPPSVSPGAIIRTAYMELLQWQDEQPFPETLLMDRKRFLDLRDKVQWLTVVSSVLMVTYNTVGDPIAGMRDFKEKLKNVIAVIIADVPFEELSSVMPNVAVQVIKEVQSSLQERSLPPLTEDRARLLKGQVEAVASPQQPIHTYLRVRLQSHIQLLLSKPGAKELQVPPGFAAMAEEFSHVYGQFFRLVSHNTSVFGVYYADIISDSMKKKADTSQAS